MADSLSGEELIDTLNTHFDCLVPPVRDRGGELLKCMVDGMLVIFPTGDGRSAASAAKCALDAAFPARRNTADINTERRYDGVPELAFGIAFNIGDIHYGNIGSEDRLDLTVIGPAVNLSDRMESIAADIGRDIVVSDELRRHLDTETEPLGEYTVKGFSKPVSIYAVPDTPSTGAAE